MAFCAGTGSCRCDLGDIGHNVADSAKGVAKGITVTGLAAGAGMGVWGCVDMYKASKAQSGQSGNYAPGIAKVVIGALALGIGEFLGSGSASRSSARIRPQVLTNLASVGGGRMNFFKKQKAAAGSGFGCATRRGCRGSQERKPASGLQRRNHYRVVLAGIGRNTNAP